jgi:hypothetical protein
MGLFDWLASPKPVPTLKIKDVLGRVLLELPGRRDLIGADLSGTNLAHVDLSGMLLDGANLEGANLIGARLVNTSLCHANLRGAEVSFANADGANFFRANLDACLMYRTQVGRAKFGEAKITHDSDIPSCRTSYADKPIKRKREEFERIPERPRALLVLGEAGFQNHKYEG